MISAFPLFESYPRRSCIRGWEFSKLEQFTIDGFLTKYKDARVSIILSWGRIYRPFSLVKIVHSTCLKTKLFTIYLLFTHWFQIKQFPLLSPADFHEKCILIPAFRILQKRRRHIEITTVIYNRSECQFSPPQFPHLRMCCLAGDDV